MSLFAPRPLSCCRISLFLLLLLVSGPATAQTSLSVVPDEPAQALAGSVEERETIGTVDCMYVSACVEVVKRAQRITETNELRAVLQALEAAYARWHSPWLLIHIGRVQQRLSRSVEAIATYRSYLATAPEDLPERIARAQRLLAETEQELFRWQASLPRVANQPTAKRLHKKAWLWATLVGAAVISCGLTTGLIAVTRPRILQTNWDAPPNTTKFVF